MNRRSFLGACIALGVVPTSVVAGSPMRDASSVVVVYAGGAKRFAVKGPITKRFLNATMRDLLGRRARYITQTSAGHVEASFLLFCHPDHEIDIRELDDFKGIEVYASRKPVHECEIGSVDRLRVIIYKPGH